MSFKVGDRVFYIGSAYDPLKGKIHTIKRVAGLAVTVEVNTVEYTLHENNFKLDNYNLSDTISEGKMWKDDKHTILGPDGLYYQPDFIVTPQNLCECGQEKAQPGSPSWMHSSWCRLYKELK